MAMRAAQEERLPDASSPLNWLSANKVGDEQHPWVIGARWQGNPDEGGKIMRRRSRCGRRSMSFCRGAEGSKNFWLDLCTE